MQTSQADADNSILDVADLEERLSRPTPGLIESLRTADVQGDMLVLGAGGKMGPTLARMARRASDASGTVRRIVAVSRFSQAEVEKGLNDSGVETIRCDMLDPTQLAALPDAPNIIYMAGMKFGSTGNASLTWAMNAELPSMVCRRYPNSRIVAFSTGNVYPLAPVVGGGSLETDEPGPIGEYAMSCLARERIFEHHSRTRGMAVSTIRLTYAVEMRYGVLVDIAGRVLRGDPVDTAMGNLCCLWQGDANAMSLQSLISASSPPCVLNITGPELLSVRQIALRFGEIFDKPALITGAESGHAYISNTQKMQRCFGYPTTPLDTVIGWTADWVRRGGHLLGKPTHFEATDGRF